MLKVLSKFLLKILKFFVNSILRILQAIYASYLFSATYDYDEFEKNTDISEPIWK